MGPQFNAIDYVFLALIVVLVGLVPSALIWAALHPLWARLRVREGRAFLGVAAVVCASPFVAWAGWIGFLWLDPLDGLERTCRAEFFKTSYLVGATDFKIRRHLDYWNDDLVSGGGYTIGWESKPYQRPKVELFVEFKVDDELHLATVNCSYVKLPDTGDPPKVAFKQVMVGLETVYRKDSNGRYVPVPLPGAQAR